MAKDNKLRLSVRDARAQIGRCLSRAEFSGERVIIQRHKNDVAAIVSMADLEILEEAENKRWAKKMRKEADNGVN